MDGRGLVGRETRREVTTEGMLDEGGIVLGRWDGERNVVGGKGSEVIPTVLATRSNVAVQLPVLTLRPPECWN